jgi:PAS domain S-box-containing protein
MSSGEKFRKLREAAENALAKLDSSGKIENSPGKDLRKILHELQVHQLELEMQNEELRRVQDMLEQEKLRYTDLFEYSPVGYLLMDKQGNIKEINQTLCSMLSISKTSVAGKNLSFFLSPESQDVFYFHLQKLLESGKSSACKLVMRNNHANLLWINMESKIFYSEKTSQYTIQSSLTDISDSKKAEDHLLRLSTAFEQSANSIIITDIDGNIQYANPRFFDTTGYSEDEIIGKNPRIIKFENSEIDYADLWKTISSGQTWKGEFLNKNKFGHLFWEIATITPVKNQEGEIINYLAIKEDITQRKLAEKNLQKAKDFYLKLLEDFPVMVWQCDQDGNFNFFNKTFSSFTGLTLKDVDNQAYINQIFPKDRDIFLDAFKQGLKNNIPFVVEYRLKDRYDNYRWVLNHAKPFTDMDGNYGGFIATCTDIHDRRTVEERLIESEDRYRRMFEDSSLGIFKLDRNFQFISANKAFAEMFGYKNTVDFLIDINNRPKKFFPDFPAEKDFRKNLVKSKENRFVIEKELLRKDKSIIYTVIHLRKVYERSRNKQFYMEGFIEDVTTRKLSENKLSLSEEKFKSLFEKSYDAILIIDNYRIAECNKKASEIFVCNCKELVNRKFSDLSISKQPNAGETKTDLQEKIEMAYKGDPQNFEWVLKREDKIFDAEISLGRIFMNNKYMVQAIVRDISEKKLVEKQLKQARDDAEKARMAQSEFLSLMSHEIRTPLNTVVSLTDLMLHEDQSTEQIENLTSVKISARHLLGLIDDILDYNKIESGNIQFDLEEFNLRQLVHQLDKVFKIKANEKNIDFIITVNDNVPEVLKADTLRLKQVLYNMISNAIKFTEKGHVSLHVEKPSENNNHIRFIIKDTGIGISANRLEAIFDRFTQEENSTSRKYGGSGLGLTICKKLVELQKGKVTAKSIKDKGSEFSFYLPMPKGKKAANDNSHIKSPDKTEYSLLKMRILMVEDDAMNQLVGKKVIEKKWKSDLVIVGSAEEAIDALAKETFDLILMDLILPKMDGYELAGKIRSGQKNGVNDPHIPIIALTADAFVETRQKTIEAGMNDFVSKPFEYDNLFNKISAFKPDKKKHFA